MRSKLCFFILSAALILSSCQDTTPPDTDTSADTSVDNVTETAFETETEEIIDFPDQVIPDDGIPREKVSRLVSRSGGYVNDRYGYDNVGRLVYVRKKNEIEPYIELTYDEEGYLAEIFDKNKDGGNREKYFFERGVYIGYETYSFSGELRPYTVVRYTYNPDGTVESCFDGYYRYMDNGDIYSQNEKLFEYSYVYSENGHLTEKYITLGEFTYMSEKYEYDENGRMTFAYKYDEEGCRSVNEYAYDGDGRVVSDKSYYGDPYVTELGEFSEIKYTYDENGDLIRKEYFEPRGGRITLYEYRYDGDGRVVYHHYESTAFSAQKYDEEYVYDENGDHIKTVRRKSDSDSGMVTEYTYRGFMLTEAEIEQMKENDALIREYVDVY